MRHEGNSFSLSNSRAPILGPLLRNSQNEQWNGLTRTSSGKNGTLALWLTHLKATGCTVMGPLALYSAPSTGHLDNASPRPVPAVLSQCYIIQAPNSALQSPLSLSLSLWLSLIIVIVIGCVYLHHCHCLFRVIFSSGSQLLVVALASVAVVGGVHLHEKLSRDICSI